MWHDYSDIKEVRRLCLIGDDHFVPCFTWTGNAEAKKKKKPNLTFSKNHSKVLNSPLSRTQHIIAAKAEPTQHRNVQLWLKKKKLIKTKRPLCVLQAPAESHGPPDRPYVSVREGTGDAEGGPGSFSHSALPHWLVLSSSRTQCAQHPHQPWKLPDRKIFLFKRGPRLSTMSVLLLTPHVFVFTIPLVSSAHSLWKRSWWVWTRASDMNWLLCYIGLFFLLLGTLCPFEKQQYHKVPVVSVYLRFTVRYTWAVTKIFPGCFYSKYVFQKQCLSFRLNASRVQQPCVLIGSYSRYGSLVRSCVIGP